MKTVFIVIILILECCDKEIKCLYLSTYMVVEVIVFFKKYYCDPLIDTENDKFPKVQLGNEYADGHCKKNHQTDPANGRDALMCPPLVRLSF